VSIRVALPLSQIQNDSNRRGCFNLTLLNLLASDEEDLVEPANQWFRIFQREHALERGQKSYKGRMHCSSPSRSIFKWSFSQTISFFEHSCMKAEVSRKGNESLPASLFQRPTRSILSFFAHNIRRTIIGLVFKASIVRLQYK
jgi:hypothetical protein